MAIRDVKLGPKSRHADAPAGAAAPPAGRGDGALGCACGRVHVPARDRSFTLDGVEHRYGLPCRPAPERAGREGDQALPTPGSASVFAEIRRRLDEREAIGVKRYGRSLETFNGRDAGRDLEDELLDALAYATQARLEQAALVEAFLVLARFVRAGANDSDEPFAIAAAMELAQKLEGCRVA